MDWKDKMTPEEREEYERAKGNMEAAIKTRKRLYDRIRMRTLREGGKPDELDT